MLATLARGTLKLLLAATLFLGTIEAYLALWPDSLPPRLANYAFSKYGAFPGGMYVHDPASNINFLKRNFETEAYFNGYRWSHRTDSFGFRNPADLVDRTVWLLGDSLIYGHGVEEPETVAHRLRTEHGISAYNMARQGDCVYQSYVLARLHTKALAPRLVVLFVFLNDFQDVTLYRQGTTLDVRPESTWDYDAMRRRLRRLEESRSPSPRLLLGLPSVRLLRGVARQLPALGLVATAEASVSGVSGGRGRGSAATSGLATIPNAVGASSELPYLDALLEPATFTRVAAYYEATLRDLDQRLGEAGAEFVVIHLAIDRPLGERWRRATDRLERFVTGTCQRLDLTCASTTSLFADCGECFLPGDGHLSPHGHRRLAGYLAERLDGAGRENAETTPTADPPTPAGSS